MRGKTESSSRMRFACAFVVGALLFSASLLHAQVDTGSISGTVTDASGAVLKGATVTLTNEGTSAELTTTTGDSGTYTFSPVRIGNYTVSASAGGFQKTTQKNLTVNVGANLLANFTLKPGAVSETVEVTSTTPQLQTQDASVGQVVDARNVNNLPLNGRNFTFLAQTVAGVNTPQADTRGNAASGAFAANGNRPAQNNYMLDGIDNNSDTVDFLNGTNFVVLPPVDAVQEFKVQTTDFSAEYGRSGAAVLNATIKSGTNAFHGTVWEFLRNDKFDARDYFEHNGAQKGEFRQNQYGFSIGGPVIIPKLFDGRNKVFFFGDYEKLARRQGVPHQGSVPTVQERGSGPTAYTNFQELITDQSGSNKPDDLGRIFSNGTILDPATTRAVTAGVADPVTGLVATTSGFVRDPFMTTSAGCPISTKDYTGLMAGCNLNILPAGRLDPNAINLLNLYPLPNGAGISSNYNVSPKLKQDRQSFDTRLDVNFSQKDQTFFRFSLVDDPQLIPGIFGGVADGGGFQEGPQTALAQQSALAWTHVFTPNTINVARAGLNYLHTTRVSPEANNLTDLPGQFGILDIPQQHENGGLPAFSIQGLQTLGTNAFLPSDEVSSTIQFSDDFTKIYGKHTFKMGFEYQHVKFSTLQPPWSRGQFQFDGVYTNVPGAGVGANNTGIAQMLLTPIASTVGGVDYVGGPGREGGPNNQSIFVSNISLTDNGKNYYGTYIQDDWKVSQKLTINLGLRWDFFGLVYEHHGNQANFVPSGAPTGSPMYIIPQGPNSGNLSTSFTSLLAQDGIALAVTNKYGKGLGTSQKTNFAPRFGFAYQATPKLVARGGFGIFYNGFENRGFSPNIGENYPFQFNFQFNAADDNHPFFYTGCTSPAVTPVQSATLETGFSCTPLDPTSSLFVAKGLALRGIQFDYITPYTMGGNLTFQYQATPSLSLQAGYVTSLARHLETFPGSNNVTQILPKGATQVIQFPDFGQGASYATSNGSSFYHGLQTTVEKRFGNGLNFLVTYTWSKVLSDARDLLNGFSGNGYRAPSVPGLGIQADYALANFDVRNVFHFTGGYELPFGKGKRYLGDSRGVSNVLVGGWSLVWSTVLQGGQPMKLDCPDSTTSGTNCTDLLVPGQNPTPGLRRAANGNPIWLNAAAFTQPCELGAGGPIAGSPAGCVPLTGGGVLGGPRPAMVTGPGYKRLDLSFLKDFYLNERFRLQFRTEMFNILNHPNFNQPHFGGNGVVSIGGSGDFTSSNFGQIGSTRDAPNDPREIQFALKLYF
jgi:carboxypeptidase family protein/TonB-dependent receptor-like protein